ncbi:MAG: hypothetical protein ACQES5_02575 [Thermodesulfobacteriota bacterium]
MGQVTIYLDNCLEAKMKQAARSSNLSPRSSLLAAALGILQDVTKVTAKIAKKQPDPAFQQIKPGINKASPECAPTLYKYFKYIPPPLISIFYWI